jgi:GH24 family phage-related lysozyme (muramidase)
MQNPIPLSVSDGIDHALQLRSERFHAGIAFLHKAKCYQQVNSLTWKGIAEPCRSWVNWFAGQHRLKLKSARPIAENRLTAGTKLKIEQFSRISKV